MDGTEQRSCGVAPTIHVSNAKALRGAVPSPRVKIPRQRPSRIRHRGRHLQSAVGDHPKDIRITREPGPHHVVATAELGLEARPEYAGAVYPPPSVLGGPARVVIEPVIEKRRASTTAGMERFTASLKLLPSDDLELMSSMLYAYQQIDKFIVLDDVQENVQEKFHQTLTVSSDTAAQSHTVWDVCRLGIPGLGQYADYGTDYETTNPLMRSRIIKLQKCHIIVNHDTRCVWKAKFDVQPAQQPAAAKTQGRRGDPTLEKGLPAAAKLTRDDLKVDSKLHVCHMLPRSAFSNEKYYKVANTLTFCVQMNGEVNTGPWAQMEREDKRFADGGRRVVLMTGICGGQFHESPSQRTPGRTIFLPSKLYRMRLVWFSAGWRVTAICLENSTPAGKRFPDDFHISMEHLWSQARDTVGVEFLAAITSFNGADFNAVALLAGVSLRDQLQDPQLPTWRELHELWVRKQRRQRGKE